MIIYNAIQCLTCNDIAVSYHRHDYKPCKCGKVAADGGLDYLRRTYSGPFKDISKDSNEGFEVIREYFYRYNRYTNSYVKLKDISNRWLQNIIDYFIDHNLEKRKVFYFFVEEKLYRAEQEIYIPNNICNLKPIIKFNSAHGSILCNNCSIIIKSGLNKEEFRGNTNILFCSDNCFTEWNMNQITEKLEQIL